MKKKILISGSAGFAGSHLVEHLIHNTDWAIVGIDSFRHRGDSMRILKENEDRYKIYCCDLSSPMSKRLKIEIGHFDYIINLASESHVDRSIIDPVPFIENNVSLTLNMLEFSRENPDLKAFIQISTDEVYGAAKEGISHKEWSPILPSNPYSASKAAQEAIAISYWRTYQVPLLITNTMNMFGERQDNEKFIPQLISKLFLEKEVNVHGNRQYIGKRHYLHARNHADALLFLVRNFSPEAYKDDEILIPSRFNVIGEVELDNLELAKTVAEIMGKKLHYKLIDFHHTRPGHDRRYALDGTKISRLGWKPPLDFRESLERTIKWTLNRPEWLAL